MPVIVSIVTAYSQIKSNNKHIYQNVFKKVYNSCDVITFLKNKYTLNIYEKSHFFCVHNREREREKKASE